jgi:predicted small metal-binding protein
VADQNRKDFNTDNPSINPQTGNVNPSAATAGTEGWGNTADERRTLSENPPSVSQEGQTRATDPSANQAAPSSTHGATAGSMKVTREGRDRTYRCADAGNADCHWETAGTEEEVLQEALEHGRTNHGWNDWTEVMRNRVRNALRERRAA